MRMRPRLDGPGGAEARTATVSAAARSGTGRAGSPGPRPPPPPSVTALHEQHRAEHRDHHPPVVGDLVDELVAAATRASAETSIRSYGARGRQAEDAAARRPIVAQGCSVAARLADPKATRSGTTSTPRHRPLRPGEVREQRGRPPGPRADVEHPVRPAGRRAGGASSATVRGCELVWPWPIGDRTVVRRSCRRCRCGRNPSRGTAAKAAPTRSGPGDQPSCRHRRTRTSVLPTARADWPMTHAARVTS